MLGLEDMWVTNAPYFRIFISASSRSTRTSLFAPNADADSKILKLTTEQFVDLLAGEMLGPRPPRQSTRLK